MSALRVLSLVPVLALAAGCEPPPDDPAPPIDGDGGDTGGGTAGGGDNGGGGSGGSPSLTLSFAPGEPPADATRIDLDIVGVALFDGTPSWADADSPCDAGVQGALVERTTRVEVPLGGERVPFLQLDLPAGQRVREVWVTARHAELLTPTRTYEVHAGRLCVMPDGLQYILLRARPGEVTLDGAREIALGLGRDQLASGQVNCRGSPKVEECDTSDDGTDGDPRTRLRYEFGAELPVRSVE
jgi:hypothetical protein